MDLITAVILAATAELVARVCVLLYQKGHSGTRTLNYRTWVLLVVFVPLAWAAYLAVGRPAPRR